MRRVLYFSGYRMKVFEWDGRRLLGQQEFEPDEDGHNHFADYLSQAVAMPTQLLVDIIEEDFRREFIPHVGSNDRKALINRLLDRHYRGDEHVHVAALGRQKDGRRDDILLLSAITNTELLTPWLKQLKAADAPLAGIWSVPLLTDQLLKPLNLKAKHVLVVSRQIKSALRESYFQEGQLIFSRQAKLDSDTRDDDTAAGLLNNLQRETDQTYRFLTNQRIMGFTETLDVVCIVPDDLLGDMQASSASSNTIRYQFVGLQNLLKQLGLTDPGARQSDSLYAFLCAQAPIFKDHYATANQKQPYHRFLIDRSVGMAASLGAILLFTAGALITLQALEIRQAASDAQTGSQALQQHYQRDYQDYQIQLDDARLVESSVRHAHRLQQEAGLAPQALFPALGDLLDQASFSDIQIDHVDWQKVRAEDVERFKQLIAPNTAPDPNAEYSEESYEEPGIYPQPVLLLGGRLTTTTRNYRDTVALMQQFQAGLDTIPGAAEVLAIHMPVDVRPDNRFSDHSGALPSDALSTDNRFEFALFLEPLRHE